MGGLFSAPAPPPPPGLSDMEDPSAAQADRRRAIAAEHARRRADTQMDQRFRTVVGPNLDTATGG